MPEKPLRLTGGLTIVQRQGRRKMHSVPFLSEQVPLRSGWWDLEGPVVWQSERTICGATDWHTDILRDQGQWMYCGACRRGWETAWSDAPAGLLEAWERT